MTAQQQQDIANKQKHNNRKMTGTRYDQSRG